MGSLAFRRLTGGVYWETLGARRAGRGSLGPPPGHLGARGGWGRRCLQGPEPHIPLKRRTRGQNCCNREDSVDAPWHGCWPRERVDGSVDTCSRGGAEARVAARGPGLGVSPGLVLPAPLGWQMRLPGSGACRVRPRPGRCGPRSRSAGKRSDTAHPVARPRRKPRPGRLGANLAGGTEWGWRRGARGWELLMPEGWVGRGGRRRLRAGGGARPSRTGRGGRRKAGRGGGVRAASPQPPRQLAFAPVFMCEFSKCSKTSRGREFSGTCLGLPSPIPLSALLRGRVGRAPSPYPVQGVGEAGSRGLLIGEMASMYVQLLGESPKV